MQIAAAQVSADDFSEDGTEIGGEREIAAFIQLART